MLSLFNNYAISKETMKIQGHKLGYTHQTPNDTIPDLMQSIPNYANNELAKTIMFIITIAVSSIGSILFLISLVILDNILAFYTYFKLKQTDKWKSEYMLTGLAFKILIYSFACMFVITIDKMLHLNSVFTILGVTLLAQPELKSIDEKFELLFKRSIFKGLVNMLYSLSGKKELQNSIENLQNQNESPIFAPKTKKYENNPSQQTTNTRTKRTRQFKKRYQNPKGSSRNG